MGMSDVVCSAVDRFRKDTAIGASLVDLNKQWKGILRRDLINAQSSFHSRKFSPGE